MLFTAALATFCTVWIIGFPVSWAPEDGNQYWSYTAALYFSYVSLTTIGHGGFSSTPPLLVTLSSLSAV
ncbi:potassium channel [Coprinopsis cinerea AmutBmut pab1-1]|nr:potassium channel [Coprinopsis cinerea AmutBmut pab1-1]